MSESVTFTLNGKPVTVPKGTTVMQAAKSEKVSIPHFCWHKGLSIAGVCRFCMVEVEGRPKLEIACNLQATEGMAVQTKTEKVQTAHKWALEFHLINHPLDCPICDQAGECGLQKYYMKVGKYKSQMARPKVLKPKALDLGERLVLDTERCILCSRCVRFEEEVTKTAGLGIFDRGDRAIIGTYNGEKIQHNYQENLVDICPVGAFTSKKFRFQQRVWFLKEKKSICPGCSTGCHINIHAKPQIRRYFRVKPETAMDVNKHWMCDDGRRVYEHINPEERLNSHLKWQEGEYQSSSLESLMGELKSKIGPDTGLLLSPQYTSEEYQGFFDYFVKKMGIKNIYLWKEAAEKDSDFDGILKRGDHNPNSAGLAQTLLEYGCTFKGRLKDSLSHKEIIALAPEVMFRYPNYLSDLKQLAESKSWVSLWGTQYLSKEIPGINQIYALKAFSEKTGSFLNFEGKIGQLSDPYPPVFDHLEDVISLCTKLSRKELNPDGDHPSSKTS
jgi:NADH-quinone oxidoreductase subunit G